MGKKGRPRKDDQAKKINPLVEKVQTNIFEYVEKHNLHMIRDLMIEAYKMKHKQPWRYFVENISSRYLNMDISQFGEKELIIELRQQVDCLKAQCKQNEESMEVLDIPSTQSSQSVILSQENQQIENVTEHGMNLVKTEKSIINESPPRPLIKIPNSNFKSPPPSTTSSPFSLKVNLKSRGSASSGKSSFGDNHKGNGGDKKKVNEKPSDNKMEQPKLTLKVKLGRPAKVVDAKDSEINDKAPKKKKKKAGRPKKYLDSESDDSLPKADDTAKSPVQMVSTNPLGSLKVNLLSLKRKLPRTPEPPNNPDNNDEPCCSSSLKFKPPVKKINFPTLNDENQNMKKLELNTLDESKSMKSSDKPQLPPLRLRLKSTTITSEITISTPDLNTQPPQIRVTEYPHSDLDEQPMDIDPELNNNKFVDDTEEKKQDAVAAVYDDEIETALQMLHNENNMVHFSESSTNFIQQCCQSDEVQQITPTPSKTSLYEFKTPEEWQVVLQNSPSPKLVLEKLPTDDEKSNVKVELLLSQSQELPNTLSNVSQISQFVPDELMENIQHSSILQEILEAPVMTVSVLHEVPGSSSVDFIQTPSDEEQIRKKPKIDNTELTQAELREIDEIAGIELTSSESEKDVGTNTKEKSKNKVKMTLPFTGKSIAMLEIMKVDQEKKPTTGADEAMDSQSSDEINKTTQESELSEEISSTLESVQANVVAKKDNSNTSSFSYVNDDFEPDYEPDDE